MSDLSASSRIAISTFVDERYQKYLPLLAYSALRSYPSYYFLFFTTGEMQSKVLKTLSLISDERIIVKNSCLRDIVRLKHMKEQYFKSLRWLFYDNAFEEFDGVFMSDVDMIICKEIPSLHEQHDAHCKKFNVPLSNKTRGNRERLLGYQYIQPTQYFLGMRDIMDDYLNQLIKRSLRLGDNERGNEWVLYQMIKDAGWIGSCRQRNHVSIHHGLHLGIWRTKPKRPANCVTKANHKNFINQFNEMKKDTLYHKIMQLVPLHEIAFMEESYTRKW